MQEKAHAQYLYAQPCKYSFSSRVKLVPKDPEVLKVPRVCVESQAPLVPLVLQALL